SRALDVGRQPAIHAGFAAGDRTPARAGPRLGGIRTRPSGPDPVLGHGPPDQRKLARWRRTARNRALLSCPIHLFLCNKDHAMILNGGYNYYGIPLGVISLDSRFPKPSHHIKHAASFDFPILYKTVKGATVARLIKERDPALLVPFLDAARELEQEGVKAITGSCGFLALYQKEIAAAVSIPVFMSSLIQVPLVSRMLGAGRPVGLVVADQHALTRAHLEGVGITDEPIVIAGMQDQAQFREVILSAQRN